MSDKIKDINIKQHAITASHEILIRKPWLK